IIRELTINHIDATLNPDDTGYWDIELNHLVIEAKKRRISFTDYDTQLFPVRKLDALRELPIDALIILSYTDGIYYVKARDIETTGLKKEQVKSLSYHLPNKLFKKASSVEEIVRRQLYV